MEFVGVPATSTHQGTARLQPLSCWTSKQLPCSTQTLGMRTPVVLTSQRLVSQTKMERESTSRRVLAWLASVLVAHGNIFIERPVANIVGKMYVHQPFWTLWPIGCAYAFGSRRGPVQSWLVSQPNVAPAWRCGLGANCLSQPSCECNGQYFNPQNCFLLVSLLSNLVSRIALCVRG